MQETTLNCPYQVNGNEHFASVHLWLTALYEQASQKNLSEKLDIQTLAQLPSLKLLEEKISYHFKNKTLLLTSLTQSTFCHEFKEFALSSNERLEFLGDSLVNLIVAKSLYTRFESMSEGDLSKLRGALVNEHSLAKLAMSIGLGENILLGKGEHKNGGQNKESLLADAFEALCAAIYFDCDEDVSIVERSLLKMIRAYESEQATSYFDVDNLVQFDSKTQLQEQSMALYQRHPTYKSLEVKDGTQVGFKVELWIGSNKLAEGVGPSKKKLEKELARKVLDEKRYQSLVF